MAIVVSPPSGASSSPSRPGPTGGSTSPRAARALPVLLPRRLARRPAGTRVYANLDEILAGLDDMSARHVTRAPAGPRGHHLRGLLLHRSARHRAPDRPLATSRSSTRRRRDAPVQLRFTTKFDDVGALLALAHRGRTRVRFSRQRRRSPPTSRAARRGCATASRALGAMARGLPGRPHDRADHAGRGLARRAMALCSTRGRAPRSPTSRRSTSPRS